MISCRRGNLVSTPQRPPPITRSQDMGGFGEGIRLRRLLVGLTQEELAERAGLSVRGLRKLEAGAIGSPRPRTVRAIATALGVGPAEWDAFRSGARPARPGRIPFRWPRPRQLPAETSGISWAEAELATVDEAVAGRGPTRVPIVVVAGPAGVATPLMLQWAHRSVARYPDGQLYARLSGAGGERIPPEVVLRGFLRALAVPAEEIPTSVDEAAALYRSLLFDRRWLVVLAAAADAEQVRPLLPGSQGPAVVLTCLADPAAMAGALGAARVTVPGRSWSGSQLRP
jgi:transcriptional regulator with XRE-family HTH domain